MWVLAVAVLLGCGGTQAVEPLPAAVRSYNEAVRWQRFSSAAAHLEPTRRDDFLDARDQLHEDLRINDYEMIRVRFDRDSVRARVHMKITWHLDSEGIVHDTHTVQTWHREGRRWFLIRENHLRGEPMPGVESSVEKESGESLDESLNEPASEPAESSVEPAATDPAQVPHRDDE